jgi:hypothetical protein
MGGTFDGRRVHTGGRRKAVKDARTGCHRSMSAPARADSAIGAGHVARLTPRRGPGAERRAVGNDIGAAVIAWIASGHLVLP